MCKIIFIGTISELQEIPFDKDNPGFYLKALTDEFQAVADKFKHSNVYNVGTSRHCGCDFGILKPLTDEERKHINQNTSRNLGLKAAKHIRSLLGQQEKWEEKQKTKQIQAKQENEKYLKQTHQLIEIIEGKTKQDGAIELYCCWAGEYEAAPDTHQIIHPDKENLREGFEIEERRFVTFKK